MSRWRTFHKLSVLLATRLEVVTFDEISHDIKHFSVDLKTWSRSKSTLWALFTKFLTPGLTREFCNPLDDWLGWFIPTNHRTDYIIHMLTQELKVWWFICLRILVIFKNSSFKEYRKNADSKCLLEKFADIVIEKCFQ